VTKPWRSLVVGDEVVSLFWYETGSEFAVRQHFNILQGAHYLAGENLKVVWAKFSHFKLGRFVVMQEVYGANAKCPCLKLKSLPRFVLLDQVCPW